MRVRIVVVVGVLGLLLATPASAVGGGANWIEWSDDVIVGRRTVAHVGLYLPIAAAERAIEDGGFHLYAWPGDDWIDSGRRLPSDAFRLAPMNVVSREKGWIALRADFVMPLVEPRVYTAAVCRDPCDTRIRSVEPTWTRVYESPGEARLEHRIRDVGDAIYRLRHRASKLAGSSEDVKLRFSILWRQQRDVRAELEGRIDTLEAALRDRGPNEPQGWFVAGAFLTLLASGFGYHSGRARTRDGTEPAASEPLTLGEGRG